MASLRRLPGSRFWIACFTLPDGTRTNRSTKTTDRRKAQGIADEWEEAAKRAKEGRLVESQARKVLSDILERVGEDGIGQESVSDFLSSWLKSKELAKSEGTHLRYGNSVQLFLEFLGAKAKVSLTSLVPRDFEKFRDAELAKGKATSTVNVDLKTLRTAFNLARRQGLITTNPVDAIELPKEERHHRETFDPEQIKAILAAAAPEWKTAILIGYYLGARLGDAVSLMAGNFDFERGTVLYKQQKTNRDIECPLHPDLIAHLNTLRIRWKDSKALLTPTLSEMPTGGRNGLSRAFKDIMRKAGIDDGRIESEGEAGRAFSARSFHSLRHSFVSTLANRGVEKDIRKKLAGHTRDQTHEGYTKRQFEVFKDAIGQLPSVIS